MNRVLTLTCIVASALLASCVHEPETTDSAMDIRITLTGIPVQDQARALEFYTEKLGFKKAKDIPVGGEFRWLTVTSPAGIEGVELLLEPLGHAASKTWQAALYKDGIPITMFTVGDLDAEHKRLVEAGVEFRTEPTDAGNVRLAVLDDGCGNWIQLVQEL